MAFNFDFGTYNSIKNAINSANIMSYTLIGGQAVAATFVIIKFIHAFVKDTFAGERKITHILELMGTVVLISVVPHTMDIIDNTFASVESMLTSFEPSRLPPALKTNFTELMSEGGSNLSNILTLDFSSVLLGITQLCLCLLGFLIWAIDCAIYAMFITERLILIQLYRFVFPLMIAFVGIDGLRGKYMKWVTSFIGILILPIPYIAIHKSVDAIVTMGYKQNSEGEAITGLLVTIVLLIASAGIKYKLLTTVSQKVSQIL